MSLRRVVAVVLSMLLVTVGGTGGANAQLFSTGPWSGLYVGVHGGYGWAHNSEPSLGGVSGGIHGGYNLQLGSAVVGIEADYTWANLNGSTAVPGVSIKASIDNSWSVRGRLGWLITPSVLLYGTAGYGGLDVEMSAIVSGIPLSGSARYNGLVLGGGGELLLTRNLMLRAEALHFAVDGNGLAAGDSGSATQLRAAISYKF